MGPIRSPSGESARHEDAQKRLISATAAAQKRRVRGLAYESPAALRGWRSGEQAGTCSAVLGAAGESRERGRGWPPRAAKAKYRTIFSTGEATRRSNGPGQPREAAPSCTLFLVPGPEIREPGGRGGQESSQAVFYACAHLGAIKRKKCIMLNADEPCAKRPSYRRPHDLHAAELIATSSSLHMQWTHPAATRTGLALFLGVDILLEQHDDILLEQPKRQINQAAR